MKLYENLYIGKSVENIAIIKKHLSKDDFYSGIYFICVSNDDSNMAVLLESRELFAWYNESKNYTIIGIASDKEEIKELLVQIIQDFVNLDKNIFGFKNFFINGGH